MKSIVSRPVRISDATLSAWIKDAGGEDAAVWSELLTLRREVRRLKAVLRKIHRDCAMDSVWDRMISAALKPKRGAK